MNKIINILFALPETIQEIGITYYITLADNRQTIFCSFIGPPYPAWIGTKRFELQSVLARNKYERLFDSNVSHNIHTDLFIDQVYRDIMAAENLKVQH